MRIRSRLLAGSAFTLAFVINPAYLGCSSHVEDGPDFGEAEMLTSLDAANEIGDWNFATEGAVYKVELSLMQTRGEDSREADARSHWFAPVAHACGTRTFMQSASACPDTTRMIVEGGLTLSLLDGSQTTELLGDEDVQGALTVLGDTLQDVVLELRFAHGGLVQLVAPHAEDYRLTQFQGSGLGPDGLAIDYGEGW